MRRNYAKRFCFSARAASILPKHQTARTCDGEVLRLRADMFYRRHQKQQKLMIVSFVLALVIMVGHTSTAFVAPGSIYASGSLLVCRHSGRSCFGHNDVSSRRPLQHRQRQVYNDDRPRSELHETSTGQTNLDTVLSKFQRLQVKRLLYVVLMCAIE